MRVLYSDLGWTNLRPGSRRVLPDRTIMAGKMRHFLSRLLRLVGSNQRFVVIEQMLELAIVVGEDDVIFLRPFFDYLPLTDTFM